jgi:flagellar biosynthesis/type III secretory pathway chaperone
MAPNEPNVAASLLSLLECLEQEYRALLDQDLEGIGAAVARKEHLLRGLASFAGVMQSNPAAGELSLAMRRALSRARDLNRRNSLVLGPRLLANHARLRCLQSAAGALGLYGADGRSTRGAGVHNAYRGI